MTFRNRKLIGSGKLAILLVINSFNSCSVLTTSEKMPKCSVTPKVFLGILTLIFWVCIVKQGWVQQL